MHPDFQRLMKEATRLTRAGDLTQATQVIQQALGASPGTASDVIDVEAHEVGTGHDPALPAPQGVQAAADPSPSRAEAPSTPEAFVRGRFGGTGLAGRDYKLYIPPEAAQQPRPLVVMLHGCTQNPDDFAAGTRMNDAAREAGVFVLYPEQSQRANPQRCWNWFKHSHQGRGRGEAHLIAGMVRELMAKHAIDASRVYVAGLSAGGAMAANLAAAYPELFAAVGVHSGLGAGVALDVHSALEAMRQGAARQPAPLKLPTIVFHGDADKTVHVSNGEQVAAAAAGAGAQWATETSVVSGRKVTRRVVVDAATGSIRVEHWVVHGAGHAWFGGSRSGSYTDGQGPDASGEMLRFFLEHPRQS